MWRTVTEPGADAGLPGSDARRPWADAADEPGLDSALADRDAGAHGDWATYVGGGIEAPLPSSGCGCGTGLGAAH